MPVSTSSTSPAWTVNGPVRKAFPAPAVSRTAAVPELLVQESRAFWIRAVSGGVASRAVESVRPEIVRPADSEAQPEAGRDGSVTVRASPVTVVNPAADAAAGSGVESAACAVAGSVADGVAGAVVLTAA